MTFLSEVQPLLLQLMPSFLFLLERFHERLLAWHLGGIFGQPMLVAQVAVVRAERRVKSGCLRPFGALVGIYSLGAALGGMIRHALSAYGHGQAYGQLLIFAMTISNLLTIWRKQELFAHDMETEPKRLLELLSHELQRCVENFRSCRKHLASRGVVLLGLCCVMGPAPLPPLSFDSFAVVWFDLVGVISYAVLVPQLEILHTERLKGPQ